MATVFLSFATQDRGFAQDLSTQLQTLGHSVWSFDEQLTPGERWVDAILSRLKDVDAVVVLVSEASSKSAWIHHELGAAVAYARERDRPIIVPVALNGAEIPAQLTQFQGIFSDGNDAVHVALRLNDALERFSGIRLAKEEKQKEAQAHIETSAAIYIERSLDELRRRETTYQRWAYTWYGVAYLMSTPIEF